jgi:thiamine-phosphate diphosphorylase
MLTSWIKPEDLKKSMSLYAVTDSKWLNGRTLPAVVEEAIVGGVTFIQFREKKLSREEFVSLAKEVKKVTDRYRVPFIINDDVEVAKEVDADGVHVGQNDTSVEEARRVLGPDKIIGVSAHNVEEALTAQGKGADYLGVGAAFATSTKLDASALSMDTLRAICQAVSIPVVAIGGINKDNILELKGTGIDGVAVVSAIFAAENVKEAAEDLVQKVKCL